MLRKYIFLMFEIESEPVSVLVYLKPEWSGGHLLWNVAGGMVEVGHQVAGWRVRARCTLHWTVH